MFRPEDPGLPLFGKRTTGVWVLNRCSLAGGKGGYHQGTQESTMFLLFFFKISTRGFDRYTAGVPKPF